MFSNSPNQELFADRLTEVLRNGARALLEQAVEAEVQGRMHRRSDREINDFRCCAGFRTWRDVRLESVMRTKADEVDGSRSRHLGAKV
jgi:hypothetical protein